MKVGPHDRACDVIVIPAAHTPIVDSMEPFGVRSRRQERLCSVHSCSCRLYGIGGFCSTHYLFMVLSQLGSARAPRARKKVTDPTKRIGYTWVSRKEASSKGDIDHMAETGNGKSFKRPSHRAADANSPTRVLTKSTATTDLFDATSPLPIK